MQKLYNYITDELGPSSFIRGLNYNSSYVRLTKTELKNKEKDLYFKVKSERTERHYNIWINTNIKEETIDDYECDCPQFRNYYSCKHVAACALKYEDKLFDEEEYSDKIYELSVSSQILDKFYKPKTNIIKKKLNLEVTLEDSYDYYHGDFLLIKYKIGEDKLYTLKGKYNSFKYSYKNGDEYQLTSKFTYNPKIHYLDKTDKKIIEFTEENGGSSDNTGDMIYKNNIDSFIKLLENKTYYIKNRQYYSYSTENPFDITLTKNEEIYALKINNIEDFKPLIDDSKYIYNDDKLYKLPLKLSQLYYLMKKNEINKIIFKKENLNKFTNGILTIIKEDIKIDENIKDIIITKKPHVKLYFDLKYDIIECKIKLEYGKNEIDYFENNPSILRDNEFESNIIERLQDLNFSVNLNKVVLEDIDDIGTFLEIGIFTLNDDYEIFTSEKIKDTSIIKKTNNSVTFSIGQKNILSYGFKLDGIKNSELSNILSSLRNKKHYHKLKNGNIIDLEKDKNIQELAEITQNLGLTNKEIEEGNGTIPKYRAIYLDSLRSGYEGVISTNNKFDELIENFKNYKDKEINLTKKELNTLRDYQKTGVKWLYNIYKTGFGGILADEMGLGKSIQLIYLIKLILKENKNAKILIVSPTSLIYNWQKEFDKFGKDMKYKVIASNKDQREKEIKDKKSNIFITTYGLVRNDIEIYEKINYDLIAIDEAQNIKNPSAGITKSVKKINSNVKLALTGTPLENSVMELWSIFDFIMPGYLTNQKKFQSLYNVKDMDEENIKTLDRLNEQIKYFILRRKKKEVTKDLPDKIENNIYIDLNPNQKKIYAAEVQKTKETMDEMIKAEGFEESRFKILQLLTKLRQICIDPSLVFENYKGESSKIEELIKIIEEEKANGHKILLFSSYKKALDTIGPKLNNNKISTYYISGEVPAKKRIKLVESFNKDDTDVFMITIKAGGTGLNLTSATVVIHLDLWWNPQVENQATDRAHRIGQKKAVEVIRIISKGTIEERILELQNKKRKLAEVLIEGDSRSENEFSRLTEKDIKSLLSMDNREK